jgi:hypothetical protein
MQELVEFLECCEYRADFTLATAPDFSDVPVTEIVVDIPVGNFQ